MVLCRVCLASWLAERENGRTGGGTSEERGGTGRGRGLGRDAGEGVRGVGGLGVHITLGFFSGCRGHRGRGDDVTLRLLGPS